MRLHRLVIASGNPGKVREFKRMLGDKAQQVLAKDDMGIGDADEIHGTFVENAIAKARFVARESGEMALADDSGLCVRALSGRPGVRSARYSKEGTDDRNNELLLSELEGKEDRAAHYHCSLVLMRAHDDPAPLVAEARWHGWIADSPKGENGFGYDPLFALDDGRTAAQMDPAEKDAASHRGLAMQAMLGLIEKEMAWT